MCSAFNPSKCTHTPGALGSRRCGARGAVGGSVPCSRVSPQSWTIPAEPRFEPTTSGYKSNALSIRPWLPLFLYCLFILNIKEFQVTESRFEQDFVDEVMIGYKGTRAGILHQYIENKPDEWGFKVFCRASSSGIIHDLLLYQGASTFFNVTLSVSQFLCCTHKRVTWR